MSAFTGFNGFGQFGCKHAGKVHRLQEFNVTGTDNANNIILLAPSWCYLALATANKVILNGFLGNKTNETLEVKTSAVVKALASCDNFCLVLVANGCLYKLQRSFNATLEEIKFALIATDVPHKRTALGEVKAAEPIRITHVACGNTITVAISDKNMVYNIPNPIHQLPRHFRVKQLQCGFEHALMLSGNGDVYSWGYGLRGQLGHDILRVEETPTLIDALAGIKITFIAAGAWHSAAISAFGDLYTWGFNLNGQLGLRVFKTDNSGLKEPVLYPLPQVHDLPTCCCPENEEAVNELEAIALCTLVKVFAGARHTIIQMSCGAIFVSGWNAHGQLGLNESYEFIDQFVKLNLPKETILSGNIICGPWCTVIQQKQTEKRE